MPASCTGTCGAVPTARLSCDARLSGACAIWPSRADAIGPLYGFSHASAPAPLEKNDEFSDRRACASGNA